VTPRRTVVGTIAHWRSPWALRAVLAALILVSGLLAFFPERYRAAASLTPTDPQSMGLSGTLNQLGAINSVFGNQTAIEVALKVGRSIYVRQIAAKKLDLEKRIGIADPTKLDRWLEDEMAIRSLRGGIIQFEMTSRNPDLARDLVAAFASATQDRLAQISRSQTAYKRDVLLQLVGDASERLARARGAYDTFRLQSRYANPQVQVAEFESRIPQLEGMIKGKEVELNATRQFATDQNMAVRQVQAELATLRAQLAQAKSTAPQGDNAVGRLVRTSTTAERLQRELAISQTLYDSYMRYLEGTGVENLTSTANVRLLEPAYVDTARQVDYRFAALAIALFLLLAAVEFYRLRPPVGDRITVRESHA
jgi:capsule polysaccharide export protein KpsE/RkpR